MARSSVKGDDAGAREFTTRLNDNTIATLWAGLSLMVSIILLTALAGTGLFFGRERGGVQGAQLGFILGLGFGVLVLGLLLRLNSVRIRMRSQNLYRGLWAGMILAVCLLLIMAFLPELFGGAAPPASP